MRQRPPRVGREFRRPRLRRLPHDGYVLALQNGLCETIIADIVGRGRTVGAFVNFGADWMGPGEILFGNRGAVALIHVVEQERQPLSDDNLLELLP